ncbi:hypothetical protein [Rhabdothermincola salaria]|uniref:hypothetical protein n=1 Tax=Rhabdothermincola salaria TaxID=2903142 RepID=UPI001E40BC6B|nr:hypothetical protein [Rhabdothermincola salaria]MCD9624262.1 hypothetical protein [Rhabdothermincola salaria]
MSLATLVSATVLPESLIETHWFAVLSTFVAINTILYVSLSIFKILPKLYLSDVVKQHGRRSETRSIYPNGHGPPEVATPSGAAPSDARPRSAGSPRPG